MDKSTNSQFPETFQAGVEAVKKMFTGTEDIVSMIKEDHKPLKELIKVMKDPDKTVAERLKAFEDFAPLLMTHAKAEEKSLYDFMKTHASLREYAFEGDIEHGLADQLSEESKRTTNQDMLGAKIKVLAELVEHHIEEEESDILPAVKSELDEKTLIQLSQKYCDLQSEIISEGQDDSPHEKDLDKTDLAH